MLFKKFVLIFSFIYIIFNINKFINLFELIFDCENLISKKDKLDINFIFICK